MPNTDPPADNPSAVTWITDRARQGACVNVFPTGDHQGCAAKRWHPSGRHQVGIVAITDDGHCVQNHEVMRRAVEYARMFDLPVLDHCQDYNMVGSGVMHEGIGAVCLAWMAGHGRERK
jgi:dihydroorotase